MNRRTGRWIFLCLAALLVAAAVAMRFVEAPPRGSGGAADEVPICEIQGTGPRSPFAPEEGNRPGRRVTTTGVVFAVLEPGRHDGFWLQDPEPPAGCAEPSSKGVFVYVDSAHSEHRRFELPMVGDRVQVTGPVSEFFGSTQVQINRPDLGNRLEVLSRGHSLPEPVALDLDRAGRDYYESLEHMRVELPSGQTYLGTDKFGETFLVPRPTETRIRRTDPRTDLLALRGGLQGGGIVPAHAFDILEGAVGPLGWSFGNTKLFVEDPGAVRVLRTSRRPEPVPPPPAGTLAMATFNLFDYGIVREGPEPADPAAGDPGGPEISVHRQKLARALVGPLHAPAVVAVQEVGGRRLLDKLARDLDRLLRERGHESAYAAVLPRTGEPRRSHVGFLVDTSRVSYSAARLVDALAPSPNAAEPGGCRAGPQGRLLHHRPPVAVDLDLPGGETWTAVAVHFKSKHGGTEENLHFEPCRVAQAESVLRHVADREHVLVLGDFNAFVDSETLQMLTGDGKFLNLVTRIPDDRRHSFAFQGRVQFLDYILSSPALSERLAGIDSPKIVTDVPVPVFRHDSTSSLAASDHDPILAYFTLPTELESDAESIHRRQGGIPNGRSRL